MNHRTLKAMAYWACMAIVAVIGGGASRAGAVVEGASSPRLVQVGFVCAQSLDRLSREAKALGVELPKALTVAGIASLPHVGAGDVDTSRPIGAFFFGAVGGESIDPADAVRVIPMKPRAGTLKSFFDAGGKPAPDSPGLVLLDGLVYRRTTADLIVGKDAAAVGAVRVGQIVDAFHNRGHLSRAGVQEVLLRGSLDMTALRRVAPQQVDRILGQLKLAALLKLAGRQYGQQTLFSFLEQMTRLDFGLIETPDDMSLMIGMAPAQVPAGGTFVAPGMPQEVILRFDMGAPPLRALPWLADAAHKIAGARFKAASDAPGDLSHELADTLFAGQAATLGVATVNDFPVLYMVQQRVSADPAPRFKQIAERSQLAALYALDKQQARQFDFSEYQTPAGLRVARLRFMEGAVCKFCIDAFRRGDAVFLAASPDQGRYVASLLDEKPHGTFTGLLNASLSLGSALSIIEDGIPKGAVSSDQLHKLHDLLRTQFLTVSLNGEPGELVLGVSVQRDLVKNLIGLYGPSRKP